MKLRSIVLVVAGMSLVAGVASADRYLVQPGAPAPGVGTIGPAVGISEPVANDTIKIIAIGHHAYSGYVVMLEPPATLADSLNQAKWSDVLVFRNPKAAVPAALDSTVKADTVSFVSDAGPTENGIADADLAGTGATVANVKAGPVIYVLEPAGPSASTYVATNRTADTITYSVLSDVPALGRIGMAALALLLSIGGFVFIRRRRAAMA